MRSSLITAILLTLAAPLAQAAGGLTIDVDEANPPFMYAQAGKAAGIYPAIVEAAFKHMNVPVTIDAKPWKRDLEEADAGQAGVAGIYKNAEREKKYDYSDRIFVERISVFYNKKAPINYSQIGDLKGKKIGAIRGWSYGDDFDNARKANAFTVDEADGDEASFKKLDAHELDAVVAITEAGSALLPKFKEVGFSATPVSANPTFLIFAKSANQKELLQKFNDTIKSMQASGEMKQLVAASLAK
jgi:polar amino acid transport system substrate-binding protein